MTVVDKNYFLNGYLISLTQLEHIVFLTKSNIILLESI